MEFWEGSGPPGRDLEELAEERAPCIGRLGKAWPCFLNAVILLSGLDRENAAEKQCRCLSPLLFLPLVYSVSSIPFHQSIKHPAYEFVEI